MGRRLEALEALYRPAGWSAPSWPLDDQLEDAADYLALHRRFGSVAVCTDREVNLIGVLAALSEVRGGGEWTGSHSGEVVAFVEYGDETFSFEISGDLAVEDLPDHLRDHVSRMDPSLQPERERERFEEWEERRRERAERPERLAREEAERRARTEESRQRGRELLERNRASVGLPPLTPQQITEWDLEGTTWGEGER